MKEKGGALDEGGGKRMKEKGGLTLLVIRGESINIYIISRVRDC